MSVSPCQARLRWRVSQWVQQNGRTHSLWYHPRGDTCCHLLWQISNTTDGFYRWLHFITWRIHADQRSRCLCMCSVFTAHLLISKAPPPPQTTNKWSTTGIKSFTFNFPTFYTCIVITDSDTHWMDERKTLSYGKLPPQWCLWLCWDAMLEGEIKTEMRPKTEIKLPTLKTNVIKITWGICRFFFLCSVGKKKKPWSQIFAIFTKC